MKAIELDKAYNPKDFEERLYKQWTDEGFFHPNHDENAPKYSVVMPPPNVTGILHMGHALNNTLPDILVRYHRMKGDDTLWVPGTDHAGIATQNVVERFLLKEGKTRQQVGREAFLKRTWEVKEKHHDIIVNQLKTIGCSCDWDHERFTMDEGLSKAVREAFVTLYERGLIYRGNYLVNYCPKCGTALADDEVEYKEIPGKLYDIKYPYSDGSGFITVATTRPETMFGDAAVAVNPDDERYKSIVGKMLDLPLTDKKIPIIADSFVDIAFGTGMVKITPAHDPNDYQCGKRHNLSEVNILNPDGTLNANCPEKYRGLGVIEARELVLQDLKEQGYFISEKEHKHEVGHCYRCGTVVEPYLSEQWFVKMDGMAQKALDAWKNGDVQFYPKKWENTYTHWLENIKDWCISRQLWWGHRIPVWYCNKCGAMMVKREDPCCCDKCGSTDIRQETDVLDTWFSSWLWPFSTLGWPETTPDFKRYFPTDALVTGYDIIFFWVSRMIMASLEFLGKVPFHDVFLTGLVRDKQGRKMSKSLGNGIDPIEVVNQYGADAMKFTLAHSCTQGQDILIDMDSFKMGSRFCNKIWNAARYLLMNLDGVTLKDPSTVDLGIMDRWIYSQLNNASRKVAEGLDSYKFNEAAQSIYEFFWNDFCDWYIEASKHSLYSDDQNTKDSAMTILLDILKKSLSLMHPFVPFITEEIYSKIPNTEGSCMLSKYPEFDSSLDFPEESAIVSKMQEAVRLVRNIRGDLQIPLDKKVHIVLCPDKADAASDFMSERKDLLSSFMTASPLLIDMSHTEDISGALPAAGPGFNVYVFVREAIDVDQEIAKLMKDISGNEKSLAQTQAKLSNEKFISNAKAEVIEKEKSKEAEFTEKISKAKQHISVLKSF
ncbi:MAG: valine--tRNA ligase [Sphaerochaetaceae bacterium]|nr:valine--tRNA ligase [Sphaerochaetaceae bacterium]MDD3162747.1 valine--tRNA ligase [Sphaerochaetaceae bacterium]MDD4006967.1 valine--tRNA ligase [Sphaerochaetaceae bacterium]MDD4396068.1 valine--tRNA ligase [Sphaerochaetaceae bacterium]